MSQDAISTPTSLSGYALSPAFASFEIHERLGAGGMGVVYRGTDRRLGRTVALKFLAGAEANHPAGRDQLLREARAASALDHPGIGTIYGIEEGADGTLCIAMAFYDGGTVADRLHGGALPTQDAIRIAWNVALALGEAHNHGIVHRDIKPSNILMTRSGVPKIVDFGLARFTEGEHTLTQPAALAGTVAYMSPEQARGEAVDGRSDIWSLGAVLFEMLTGTRAFSGREPLSQLYSVLNHNPDLELISEPALRRVVQRSLTRDPASRYNSAVDMATDLHALLQPEIRSPRTARKLLTRRMAAAAVVLALAGVGTAIAIRYVPTARRPVVVAFLPFANEQDPATAALATGLSGALSDRMERLHGLAGKLNVVPASELMERNVRTPIEALRDIGANAAVSGTLERTRDGSFHLLLQLSEGAQVHPATIDATDVRQLEEKAAAWLANALEIRAGSAWPANQIRNEESYEAWLRGLGYLQRWDKPANLENAIAAFSASIGADDRFAPAYVGMAEASRTRFRAAADPASLQHALTYARQAVSIDSEAPQAHVVLGRIYHDTGQRDLAVLEFRRALELDPGEMSALAGMARAYEDLGRLTEAETALRRVVAGRPYAWTAPNTLGGFYMRRGRYADAEKAFRTTLALTPDNAAVLSNLGVALLRQRRYPEAIEAFRRSIHITPTWAAELNIGVAHYRRRDFRQAAEHCERALQLNSRDYRTWGTYAHALRMIGDRRNAFSAYRDAIRLGEEARISDAGQPRTRTLLALYYAYTGERQQAARYLEEGLAAAASDRDALVDAAATFEKLGQRAEAIAWARRALGQGVPWQDFREDPDFDALLASGALTPPQTGGEKA